MKKLLTGILFMVMTTFGLVAVAQPPASADPYPGTVATTTTVQNRAKVKRGKKISLKVTVTASGNVPVTGTLGCTVKRRNGGYDRTVAVSYNGGQVKLKLGKIKKKGKYTVTCTFTPPTTTSALKTSTGTSKFKGTKPRRF